MNILNALNQKVSHYGAGVLLSVLCAKRGGNLNIYILNYMHTIFSYNYVWILSGLKYYVGLVPFIADPVNNVYIRMRNNMYSIHMHASIFAEYNFPKLCYTATRIYFFKQVLLERKLSSWGIGASHIHCYIYMFLDIYNCRVRLGIKWDFRCEVFKYEKSCTEKYRQNPSPPRHPPWPQEK